ncbi:MAG: MarR family transcriptional regulator [Gemmatimonadetes bacterium]|nr:MarR family transcriptional regulator [Gemmatimonadota bacterium]
MPSSAKRSTAAPPAHESPTYPEREARGLALWVALTRAQDSVAQHSAADIARHGITGGEFGILELLYHKGPMFLNEVQKRVLVSSGGVTYLVDRLVERGLLERRLCQSDRRARYAALTRKGRALLRQVFPEHARAIADAVSALTPEEQKQARILLRKLGLGAKARLGPRPVGDE